MTVSGTPASLQSLLNQLEPAAPAAPPRTEPAAPAAKTDAAPAAQSAAAEPRVKVPEGATTLDPNAPRGTYLNLTV